MRGNHRLERRGHHARHEVRDAVERDGRSPDVRARAKSAPPQSVRQHHDAQSRRRIVRLIEVAPERWMNAEQAEVVPRDAHAVELRGAAFVDDRRLPPADDRQLIERAHARAPIEGRFESDVADAAAVVARSRHDETICRRIGHGRNQRAIRRRADHGRRADADGEREDRHRGKPRRAPDRAKCEMQILPESVHERSPVQQGCGRGGGDEVSGPPAAKKRARDLPEVPAPRRGEAERGGALRKLLGEVAADCLGRVWIEQPVEHPRGEPRRSAHHDRSSFGAAPRASDRTACHARESTCRPAGFNW